MIPHTNNPNTFDLITTVNLNRRFLLTPKNSSHKSSPKGLTHAHTLIPCFFQADILFLSPLAISDHPPSMAGEELNRPPSLPPYAEMIFAAIDALKEKEGCSKSSISNYIESTCGSLPEEHNNILADQLNKLVENGELVVLNENYTRPDVNTPAKRGRGRPPKAKDPALVESRGQPQTQAETESEAPAQPGSEVKRGRGRPKKDPNAPSAPKKAKVASVPTPPSKTGRPRGRPRKVQPEPEGVEAN